MAKRRLSDKTIQAAISAIEAKISTDQLSQVQGSLEDLQALFDARRELSALAAPATPKAAGRPKGSKNAAKNGPPPPLSGIQMGE